MFRLLFKILIVPLIWKVVPRFMSEHRVVAAVILLSPFIGIIISLIYHGIWIDSIFSNNPEVAYIIKLETDGNIVNYMPILTTLVVTFLLGMLFVLVFEPIYYRTKGNIEKYNVLMEGRNNAIVFFILYIAVFVIIYLSSGSKLSAYEQDFYDDIELYRRFGIDGDCGTIAPDAYTPFITVDGIEYIEFNGSDGKKHCLHASPKQLEKVDFSESCVYTVSYLPNTEILVDIEPKESKDFAKEFPHLYGFDSYSELQQKIIRFMLQEELVRLWEQAEDEDTKIPMRFDGARLDYFDVEALNDYYRSYNFEYFTMPHEYSKYNGTRDEIIVTKYMSRNDYIGNLGTMECVGNFYENYKNTLDEIVGSMPSYDNDYDKVKYLTEYIINSASPVDEELQTKITDDEELYLCMSGYGTILEKRGNSSGYAQALYGLLKRAGVEVIPVTESSTYYKMLMVKLDGKWYYIDVFSADYYSLTDCFLFGEDDLKSLYSFEDRDSVELYYGYTNIDAPEAAKESISMDI